MAEEHVGGYGYESDEVTASPFKWGLNAGGVYLKKFEWIPNGGKDGAEQEALDIVFNIKGKEKSYRQFPVTQAFGKNGEVTTDPKAPEFIEAEKTLNAVITHIGNTLCGREQYKAGMARPINSFKHYCEVVKSLLPQNTPEIELDIFMQWQWQPSKDQTRAFLEIPKKMKQGYWLSKAVKGNWKEIRTENPEDNQQDALFYYDEEAGTEIGQDGKTVFYKKIHPIQKNGWFMKSNYAIRVDNSSSNGSGYSASASNSGTTVGFSNVSAPASSISPDAVAAGAAAQNNTTEKKPATW